MTRANLLSGPMVGSKKPRFTGRGIKPRVKDRKNAPAKKTSKEPCPKSRAKHEEGETV